MIRITTVACFGAIFLGTAALAASAQNSDAAFSQYADPNAVVLAADVGREAFGKAVRYSAFKKESYLEFASVKHESVVNENGVAVAAFHGLEPHTDYAFAIYIDENGDDKLNRGFFGAPTEPFAFSNNVVPKLNRPTFEETKVKVAPGDVIVIRLNKKSAKN